VNINANKLHSFNTLSQYLVHFQHHFENHCEIIDNPLLQNG